MHLLDSAQWGRWCRDVASVGAAIKMPEPCRRLLRDEWRDGVPVLAGREDVLFDGCAPRFYLPRYSTLHELPY